MKETGARFSFEVKPEARQDEGNLQSALGCGCPSSSVQYHAAIFFTSTRQPISADGSVAA